MLRTSPATMPPMTTFLMFMAIRSSRGNGYGVRGRECRLLRRRRQGGRRKGGRGERRGGKSTERVRNCNRTGARGERRRSQLLVHDVVTARLPFTAQPAACGIRRVEASRRSELTTDKLGSSRLAPVQLQLTAYLFPRH